MHRLIRSFRTATTALRRNVLRSVLTCLGIIIGVAAVIAIMEIGNGASASIEASMATMGANNVVIWPGAAAASGVKQSSGSALTLTPTDCDAIRRECPAVRYACPIVYAHQSPQIVFGHHNWQAHQIRGTTASFLDIRGWLPMAAGDVFTDDDVRNAAQVCVIGQTIARNLFDDQSPLGQDIRVGTVTFRVVGVLTPKGANMWGDDQDDILIAPWTTVKYRVADPALAASAPKTGVSSAVAATSDAVNTLSNLYPANVTQVYPTQSTMQQADAVVNVRFRNIDQIMCAAYGPASIQPAVDEVTGLLRARHRIVSHAPEDFQVHDMTELSDRLTGQTKTMTFLLLVVATISLVVGGVGIMNIMLVSVTERTREIGLRMAVGARGLDILRQFLTEAMVLCLAGGMAGILIGRVASLIVRHTAGWNTRISWPAIFISVAVSAFVGVAFGFYPAWKASRLDPIEALRYE